MARSIYCSKCKEIKECRKYDESYCKKCKGDRLKSSRLKARLAKGRLPLGVATSGLCKIEGCNLKVLAKFMCSKHYTRVINYGDPFTIVKGNKTLTKETFCQNYNVAESGCWVWNKRVDKDGYGIVSHNGSAKKAHRFAYELFNGLIPNGAHICHKCDNPSCVNPLHLYAGDALENVRDREYKNRGAKGSKIGNSRLTEEKVLAIKRFLLDHYSQAELAKKYGVSLSAINKIASGRTWRHV